MLRGSQERRWEHRQREERGSGEGRHRDRGRGSHFQGKVRQGREEGSKGKPEEGWRRRGNDQGRIKPPQWLAWGGFVHWCPWFGSSGCAEGGLPGAALGGFESRPISASLTTCLGIDISISHHMPGDRILGCSQAPGSAGGKTVHSQIHCPLPRRVGSGFARTRSCFGNSLTQESLFFLPLLFCCSLPPPPFSLSANAQQMGGNAILNATAS